VGLHKDHDIPQPVFALDSKLDTTSVTRLVT